MKSSPSKDDSSYVIHVSREASRSIASIPELCIAEIGATPEEAMLKVLRAESDAKKAFLLAVGAVPPSSERIDPFPRFSKNFTSYFSVLKKILFGYFVCFCLTALIFLMAFPSARTKVEQYLTSKELSTGVRAALAKAGVAACLESR